MKQLFSNAVMNKEFKLRFRSGKSFLGVLFYLLVIGVLIIGFIFVQSFQTRFGYYRPEESRLMFYFLSVLQLILLLFITPGLTAGVISGEREKQTLNILLTTTQSSLSIVIGKLVSSLSYLLVLLISSLPLYSFVFLFGGVSPSQVLSLFAIYLVTVFSVGSIGVLFSTILRKTIVSIITSYSVMLFLALGTAFLFFITMGLSHGLQPLSTNHPVPYIFAVMNPFIVTVGLMEPFLAEEINNMMYGTNLPLWVPFTLFYLLIFFVCTIISVNKLRPKMKSKSVNE